MLTDQRGLVADWLVKLVIGFAVFGVIGYDVGSIIVNHFTLDTSANDVAVAVSTEVSTASAAKNYTDNEIWRLAKAEVEAEEGGVAGARVLKRGTDVDDQGIVHIRLKRISNTLIVKRIGPLKKWTKVIANGQAGTTGSASAP